MKHRVADLEGALLDAAMSDLTPWLNCRDHPVRDGWYDFDQGDGKVRRAFFLWGEWRMTDKGFILGIDDRLYIGTRSKWRGKAAAPTGLKYPPSAPPR